MLIGMDCGDVAACILTTYWQYTCSVVQHWPCCSTDLQTRIPQIVQYVMFTIQGLGIREKVSQFEHSLGLYQRFNRRGEHRCSSLDQLLDLSGLLPRFSAVQPCAYSQGLLTCIDILYAVQSRPEGADKQHLSAHPLIPPKSFSRQIKLTSLRTFSSSVCLSTIYNSCS